MPPAHPYCRDSWPRSIVTVPRPPCRLSSSMPCWSLAPSPRYRALWAIQRWTTGRISECLSLRWGDLNGVVTGVALGDQLLGNLKFAGDLLRCVPGAFHGRVPGPVWPDEDSHSPWTGCRGPRQLTRALQGASGEPGPPSAGGRRCIHQGAASGQPGQPPAGCKAPAGSPTQGGSQCLRPGLKRAPSLRRCTAPDASWRGSRLRASSSLGITSMASASQGVQTVSTSND